MIEIQRVLRDESVRREVAALTDEGRSLPAGAEWNVTPTMVRAVIDPRAARARDGATTRPLTEAVVLKFMRPVLLIRNNRIELPRSEELRNRLIGARARLEARLPSVGRIEFEGHPQLRWGGTGWMIDDHVVVTNRHVAEKFATRKARAFPFRLNVMSGAPMSARIDFKEELAAKGRPTPSLEVAVKRVLFIEPDGRRMPDLAFLELEPSNQIPPPIPVLTNPTVDGADIAVVGYPARDPNGVPENEVARRIFGDIYDVKRLSPGKVLVANKADWWFTHDATTLGGNSGSAVLDLATGGLIGVHYAGEFQKENYAVNAQAILNALSKLKLRARTFVAGLPGRRNAETIEESVAEDLSERTGFDEGFLGGRHHVSLPTKTTTPRDVLRFGPGRRSTELKYTHFSLTMSQSRKMCLWSAVNIDGSTSSKATRTAWRLDRRIPADAQTRGDVYGNEPHFARGHMTRREDPIWGSAPVAAEGNSDSMHLTNAVPQMQPFNAGIWNGLEDYALQHARKDQMRISVITGPVLRKGDPVKFGTQIPVEFWKVIAFIHDDTGRLTATGYTMSQESFFSAEEFVYGEHDTYQVAIKTIEVKTGLSFNGLARRDPIRAQDEGARAKLTDFSQIQYSEE